MNENDLIHRLLEIFEYKNDYQLQTSKIQPQDMYVLERIYFNKKIAAKDISKKYSIPPSTLTGIIDRLEHKELIERLRSSIDRRAVELITTDKGKAIVEQHAEEDKIFSKNFFNSLGDDKKGIFTSLLEELLDNINKEFLFTDTKIIDKEVSQ